MGRGRSLNTSFFFTKPNTTYSVLVVAWPSPILPASPASPPAPFASPAVSPAVPLLPLRATLSALFTPVVGDVAPPCRLNTARGFGRVTTLPNSRCVPIINCGLPCTTHKVSGQAGRQGHAHTRTRSSRPQIGAHKRLHDTAGHDHMHGRTFLYVKSPTGNPAGLSARGVSSTPCSSTSTHSLSSAPSPRRTGMIMSRNSRAAMHSVEQAAWSRQFCVQVMFEENVASSTLPRQHGPPGTGMPLLGLVKLPARHSHMPWVQHTAVLVAQAWL